MANNERKISENSADIEESFSNDSTINTDGRDKGDWKSIYPKEAKDQINRELAYLVFLLAVALAAILLNWLGVFTDGLKSPFQQSTLTTYIYYFASGLLGGVTFGGKYLYRVVGRGYWTQDRWVWRFFSPLISMVLGFIIGAMVECGVMESINTSSGAHTIVIGFLAGYFADEAVGFMCDVAEVIFRKRK